MTETPAETPEEPTSDQPATPAPVEDAPPALDHDEDPDTHVGDFADPEVDLP